MPYARCRELFQAGILDCLNLCTPKLREVVGDANGVFPVNGVTLSILPWFGQAGIAFRVRSDPATLRVGEWAHYDDFVDLCADHPGPLADAARYAREVWESPPAGLSGLQMAHLIFLAGAEALLSESVRGSFYAILDAIQSESVFTGQFSFANQLSAYDGWFEYVVSDPDGNSRANYCDIVRANEVTRAALPAWK
jgi:hypothetical protein